MTLYLDKPAVGNWPEPLESTWQLLGGDKARSLAPKLPHLGLSDILFLSTVLSIGRSERPWGIVTWLPEVFNVSRPGLYALVKRVLARLQPEVRPLTLTGGSPASVEADLQDWLARQPHLQPLADQLHTLLDAAGRTSSMIENINGLLQQFLHQHRAFRNLNTLQLYPICAALNGVNSGTKSLANRRD